MNWKKIGKIVGSIVLGGSVGSGIPGDIISLPPELMTQINALIGAIVGLILMITKAPKDE